VSPRSREETARVLVEIGRLLYEKSLVASTEGNLSARIEGGRILITPAGTCKGRLREGDLVTLDASGVPLSGTGKPSSEADTHVAIYRARPDVGAIVHAHPPTATGFAVAGLPLADCVLPEVLLSVGSVPLAPYGTPGGADLAEKVLTVAQAHDAFLLKNHGAVALGRTPFEAFHRMELIESFARILLTARTLGRVEPLAPEHVRDLLGMAPRPERGGERCGACRTCGHGAAHAASEAAPEEEPLVEEVLRRVVNRLRGTPG
jgi:L-fuculose-phosphate aldolase